MRLESVNKNLENWKDVNVDVPVAQLVDKVVALKDLGAVCDKTIDKLGQKFKKATEKCEISLL